MKKRIMAVFVVMVLSVFAFTGCNRPLEDENGLAFYLNKTTQEYTVYAGRNFDTTYTEVVIPSVFKGKPVTEILNGGFNNMTRSGSFGVGQTDKIKSISIPTSIKQISEWTFVGCAELENITVEDGNSFYKSDSNCLIEIATDTIIAGCGTSIIPDYIIAIAHGAFQGTKLWNSAPNNSVVYVGKWVVGYKGNLDKTIVLEPNTIGIGDGAFAGCSQLENITLSPTLIHIGGFIFSGCSITSVIIPSSVTHISYNSFIGSSLKTIYAEAAEKPIGWDEYFIPANCSVVWGYGG